MGIFTRYTDNHNKTRYNLYTDTCNAFTINLTSLYRYSCKHLLNLEVKHSTWLIFVNIEFNAKLGKVSLNEWQRVILTYAQKKKICALLSQKPAPTQTAVAYQYSIK